jgi:hypothetical protein
MSCDKMVKGLQWCCQAVSFCYDTKVFSVGGYDAVLGHYMRKPHLRRVRMKDGDAQITHLRHRVLHYRVVRNAQLDESLISIHWRHVKSECVADYKSHLRRALRVHISNLIPGWALYDTNTRHAQDCMSSITKKSETCFILERRRLNYRQSSLWH